jgi:hypothetical protein
MSHGAKLAAAALAPHTGHAVSKLALTSTKWNKALDAVVLTAAICTSAQLTTGCMQKEKPPELTPGGQHYSRGELLPFARQR